MFSDPDHPAVTEVYGVCNGLEGDDLLAKLDADGFEECHKFCSYQIECFFFSYGDKNPNEKNCILHRDHTYTSLTGRKGVIYVNWDHTYNSFLYNMYENYLYHCYWMDPESNIFEMNQ